MKYQTERSGSVSVSILQTEPTDIDRSPRNRSAGDGAGCWEIERGRRLSAAGEGRETAKRAPAARNECGRRWRRPPGNREGGDPPVLAGKQRWRLRQRSLEACPRPRAATWGGTVRLYHQKNRRVSKRWPEFGNGLGRAPSLAMFLFRFWFLLTEGWT